ncbi:hypothetical protein [Neptuniibacter sp.]|uniref:hypothetical protein n=1 Tax=Neptuniibacter sp. TaxID=1962643 RepID=UPI0026197C26|nr:hypothetical protein [Neptuniibacter sp.]MCP4596181.1 hypothetical protein [Neptuniibacter sp.]
MNHQQQQIANAAKAIEKGIMNAMKRLLVWLVIGYFLIAAIGEFAPRDDTDGATRSGMKPHFDSATGCYYLSVESGGLTLRVNIWAAERFNPVFNGCRRHPLLNICYSLEVMNGTF